MFGARNLLLNVGSINDSGINVKKMRETQRAQVAVSEQRKEYAFK